MLKFSVLFFALIFGKEWVQSDEVNFPMESVKTEGASVGKEPNVPMKPLISEKTVSSERVNGTGKRINAHETRVSTRETPP